MALKVEKKPQLIRLSAVAIPQQVSKSECVEMHLTHFQSLSQLQRESACAMTH